MAADVSKKIEQALSQIPYAMTLGIVPRYDEDDGLTLVLPFSQDNIGNPILPALHGGCVGGLMEITAICQLLLDLAGAGATPHNALNLPKPIGINIDYLRRGRPVETYARAVIFKAGSRVSNVRVEAWQEDIARPIAALHGHFLTAKNG